MRACGLALLLALAPSVWAKTCSYFDAIKDNGDGTVTDPRSDTVWQRCEVGQTWSGTECIGKGKEMSWAEALVAAKTDRYLKMQDWRLPTKNEAESVVGSGSNCGNGFRYASALLYDRATHNGGVYWMSSAHETHTNYVWYVSFALGSVNSNLRSSNLYGRLVRAGLPSSMDEFNREFSSQEAILAAAKRKEQLEREQAMAKAAVEAKQAADAARKQREYENSPARKAQKRREERQAAADAKRESAAATLRAQKERAQSAANAAMAATNNAQACGRLYAGKPVTFPAPDFYDKPAAAYGVITGIGNGVAGVRVTGGTANASKGFGIGSVVELSCTVFW